MPQRHQPTLPTGDEKRREIVFHATERRRGDERAQVDRHGATAAQWAAGGGHVDCLRFLLEDCGVVPTAASACLYTARLSSLFLCLSITPLTSLASSRCFRWPALTASRHETASSHVRSRSNVRPLRTHLGMAARMQPHNRSGAPSCLKRLRSTRRPPYINQNNSDQVAAASATARRRCTGRRATGTWRRCATFCRRRER